MKFQNLLVLLTILPTFVQAQNSAVYIPYCPDAENDTQATLIGCYADAVSQAHEKKLPHNVITCTQPIVTEAIVEHLYQARDVKNNGSSEWRKIFHNDVSHAKVKAVHPTSGAKFTIKRYKGSLFAIEMKISPSKIAHYLSQEQARIVDALFHRKNTVLHLDPYTTGIRVHENGHDYILFHMYIHHESVHDAGLIVALSHLMQQPGQMPWYWGQTLADGSILK